MTQKPTSQAIIKSAPKFLAIETGTLFFMPPSTKSLFSCFTGLNIPGHEELALTNLASGPDVYTTSSAFSISVVTTARGVTASRKVLFSSRSSMTCCSFIPSISPCVGSVGSNKSVHAIEVALFSIVEAARPRQCPAPITAPMLVPTTRSTFISSRSNTFNMPMCAMPRAPPPPNTKATFLGLTINISTTLSYLINIPAYPTTLV